MVPVVVVTGVRVVARSLSGIEETEIELRSGLDPYSTSSMASLI